MNWFSFVFAPTVSSNLLLVYISCHSTQTEEARHVYIAGYTADVLEDSTQTLLSAGMDSVIPKPEPTDAFECELRAMMRRFAANCGTRGP